MSRAPDEKIRDLQILQVNLNKSVEAHFDLYNSQIASRFDIIMVQEPYIHPKFVHIRTPNQFLPVFPADRLRTPGKMVRSVIWVSVELEIGSWRELPIAGSNDLTTIQLLGNFGRLTIFNIYNDNTNMDSVKILKKFLPDNTEEVNNSENDHILWGGDFNCHSALWDRDEDMRLFTSETTRWADKLIELVAEHGMQMALPKGIPTFMHMVWKKESRTDNVWCSEGLINLVNLCEVDHNWDFISTDHHSIVTTINLPQHHVEARLSPNFRMTNWEEFCTELRANEYFTLPHPQALESKGIQWNLLGVQRPGNGRDYWQIHQSESKEFHRPAYTVRDKTVQMFFEFGLLLE